MNMRIICNGALAFGAAVSLALFAIGDVQAATKGARIVRMNTTEIPAPMDISDSCFTLRADAGPRAKGIFALSLNDTANLGINGTSRVFVAVGQGNDAGKVIAPATFTLHEVAPRTGGVDIFLEITNADSPQVSVDFLVCNP
jgi:hypothetical protein